MIRALMIVEMAGTPGEHVKESLSKHVMILDKVNDLEVHSIKISEPQEIETHKGMYSCFAECDFSAPTFARLSETMFDFMPSSVEVLEPGKVEMDLHEASSLLNNISGRLHRYDEIANIANFKIKQLTKALQEQQGTTATKKTNKKTAKKTSKKKATKKTTAKPRLGKKKKAKK